MNRSVLVALGLCGSAVLGQAQGVPLQTLAAPELEYREGLTRLQFVAELSGDRVVITARDPQGPTLLNLRTGTATPIGRKGQGPGEWASISGAFPLPGDTTALVDNSRGLLLRVTPAGAIQPATQRIGTSQLDGVDTQGRAYFPGGGMIGAAAKAANPRVGFATAAEGRRDSVPLIRLAPGTGRADTLEYSRLRQSAFMDHMGPTPDHPDFTYTRVSSTLGASPPLAPFDVYAVGRDGRLAVVRSPEYQVIWIYPDGRRVTGPPVAFTPVRPNDSDRKSYMSGPLPGAKPPVRSARIAPNGELWVELERNDDDLTPTFDVINGAGALVRRVRLPAGTRLVAFGNGTAYLVRTDANDLEYLQRYRLP